MHTPIQLLIYFPQWLTIKAEVIKATNVNMVIYQHHLQIKFRATFQRAATLLINTPALQVVRFHFKSPSLLFMAFFISWLLRQFHDDRWESECNLSWLSMGTTGAGEKQRPPGWRITHKWHCKKTQWLQRKRSCACWPSSQGSWTN